jgi:hypothetical protein
MTTEPYIWIITDDEAPTPEKPAEPTGGRDWNLGVNPYATTPTPTPTQPSSQPSGQSQRRPGKPLSVAKLEAGMSEFMESMGQVLKQAQAKAGAMTGMELDEVEVAVEVSGEGQVSLMGNGVNTTAKGTMTLHFKKAPVRPTPSDQGSVDQSVPGQG